MLTPVVMAAFGREMQKIAFVAETGQLLGEQARLAGNLLNPTKAVGTLKDIYHSSSNLHPEAANDLADEIAKANAKLTAKGIPGQYVGGSAAGLGHGAEGLLGKARAGGWLSNYAKYEGPSMFRKGRNMIARALPGQRTMLMASTLPTAYSSMKKVDQTGRERGIGERVLGTAGALTGTLATQAPSVVRSMGRAGFVPGALAGLAGSYILGSGLSRVGRYAGRKIDELGHGPAAQQGPQPQPQQIQNRPM